MLALRLPCQIYSNNSQPHVQFKEPNHVYLLIFPAILMIQASVKISTRRAI